MLYRGYMFLNVLRCVAVWCSVSRCVAVCCSVLQSVTEYCSVLQCVAVCCSVSSRYVTMQSRVSMIPKTLCVGAKLVQGPILSMVYLF